MIIPVSGGSVDFVVAVSRCAHNNATNGPEHLQHLSARCTKLDRHNLGAVSGSIGDEDTPRKTFEDLCSEEDRHGVSEKEDENESVQCHKTAKCCPTVSDARSDRTGDHNADQGTELAGNLKSGLPFSCDNPFDCAIGFHVLNTILPLECAEGHEVTHEKNVVRFHNLHASVLQSIEQMENQLTIVHDMTKAQKEAMG